MKIKVVEENKGKIEEVLLKEIGKARAHTHSVSDIFSEAEHAESKLEELDIPKKMRSGAIAFDQGAGPGKAYARKSYYVISSNITLTRGSKDWFLTDVKRIEISADKAGEYIVYIDQEAVNHGLSRNNITVRQAA